MATSDENFAEYFTLAQAEALTARESHIVDLRYGFVNGEPHTLEQVGEALGVSRERIRQILQRVHRKISTKGKRQITKGQIAGASARLLHYLRSILRPEESGNLDRIFAFARDELAYLPQETHALPLLIRLLYGQGGQAEEYLFELIQLHRQEVIALWQAAQSEAEFKNLLTYIIWPPEITRSSHTFEAASKLSRQREVSLDSEGKVGIFFSEKMGREVQYESLLELQFLLKLEKIKEVVFYQEQPFVIPYELGGLRRIYYPDIFFFIKDGRGVVVEVKPRYQMALYENLIKWSALRKFCVQNGWGYLIIDGNRPIQKFQQHEFSREFQTALLTALENSRDGTLNWQEYRRIRDQHSATWSDFLAVILKNRLVWSLQPFVLKQKVLSSSQEF